MPARVPGFRCIDDLTIDFDEVTGANSTGKSSVLHALDRLFAEGDLHAEDIARLGADGTVSFGVTFADLSVADLQTFGTYIADVRSSVEDSRRQNRLLLRMLGVDEEDQPLDAVHTAHGTFQNCLEDVAER